MLISHSPLEIRDFEENHLIFSVFCKEKYDTFIAWAACLLCILLWFPPGIDEILNLEKISRGNGSFFSISSWTIELSFLEMLSNVKILKKKFSFSSRKNEILQTDSLSLLDSSLNVFSNSREKSYFALWVDFDHQCFAERESILKRQFCVVEQYSDFSLQKHFMETTTTKSHLWEYFEWLPSGKGICKTCKNEIVD